MGIKGRARRKANSKTAAAPKSLSDKLLLAPASSTVLLLDDAKGAQATEQVISTTEATASLKAMLGLMASRPTGAGDVPREESVKVRGRGRQGVASARRSGPPVQRPSRHTKPIRTHS
jgi:hypothetical protein